MADVCSSSSSKEESDSNESFGLSFSDGFLSSAINSLRIHGESVKIRWLSMGVVCSYLSAPGCKDILWFY